MRRHLLNVVLFAAIVFLGMTAPANALFTNGGFENGNFTGWTIEHAWNYGLTVDSGTGVPISENPEDYNGNPGWIPGPWTDNASIGEYLDYYDNTNRAVITSGTDNDAIALILPKVKYGNHSVRVNSQDGDNHITRIHQESALTTQDLDNGRFHVRFAWAAVLEDPGHDPAGQPYFHITLKKVSDNTILYSKFFYSNQPDNTIVWRADNTSNSNWKWIDWQDVDLDITDNVALGDVLRIELSVGDCAYGGHGGYAFLDGFRSQASAEEGGTTLSLQNNGIGAGWFGSCGMVVGRDGKGPMSGAQSAGMIALYFALLLLPVGILKLVHRRKRLPFEKAGIVALFVAASMLAASSAHAIRLIAPKAQRFHPATDGSGALTVESDETIGLQKFGYALTLSGAKKPLDVGDIHELKIQEVVVDELYAADLTAAYGITKDISLGVDLPFFYSRDGLNVHTGVRDDDFNIGDVRVNAKFRVLDGKGYGLAFVPFANFATANRDYLLSEGKFGFGMKAAGHYDVTQPLTLYANLGAEHVGPLAAGPRSDRYYTPWIQYGVGAKYALPGRNHSVVAEVNGETAWATPYRHSTLSPLELLAAYRTEVAPGWTLQAGGGGGLNKGMSAPQWRAFLGVAYR